jgi:hypothetical protein
MSAMAPVHEEVHAEAGGQEEQKRQGAEDMGAMLGPENNPGDSEENTQRKSSRAVQERSLAAVVRTGLCGYLIVLRHDLPTSSRARFSSSELPMTDSELAVMAITPIIGCSSPRAAMGIAATL